MMYHTLTLGRRSDAILFMFLEEYLLKLENPLAVQVWTRFLSLAKDIATNAKEFRSQSFPVLRYADFIMIIYSRTKPTEAALRSLC